MSANVHKTTSTTGSSAVYPIKSGSSAAYSLKSGSLAAELSESGSESIAV